MTEKRSIRAAELRAEGRRLSGVVMPYNEVAVLPWGRERFDSGAFSGDRAAEVRLNLQHQRTILLTRTGAGLTLDDTPQALRMVADLPDTQSARDCVELVRANVLRGLSVEFEAIRERSEGDLRIVESAILSGIGVVDDGAYTGATVEARRRSGRTMRATMPVDSPAACECVGEGTTRAVILQDALSSMWERAFTGGSQRAVTAYLENYAGPLASTSRGTLRGRVTGAGGYEVDIDIPDSAVGRDLVSGWEDAGLIVRPFLADVEGPVLEGVRYIEQARLRAFIVTATDARDGWPDPTILPTPDELLEDQLQRQTPRRRRFRA